MAALAVALLVTIGVGTAVAGDREEGGIAPFVVAEPRLGDHGVFTREFAPGTGALPPEYPRSAEPWFEFWWRDGGFVPDAQGNRVKADRLDVVYLVPDAETGAFVTGTLWYQAGTMSLLASSWFDGRPDASDRLGTAQFAEPCSFAGLVSYEADLFLNSAMGVRADPATSLRLAPFPVDCDHDWGSTYGPSGMVEVDGVPAVRWANGELESCRCTPAVALAPGVPYVLEEVSRIASSGWEASQTTRLVAFTRGLTERVPGPPPVAPPPLEFQPRQPWGMDDSGIDHPFPLSLAFRHARDEPSFRHMRDFLRDRPDAFVAQALSLDVTDDTARIVTWVIQVSDGRQTLLLAVNRTWEHAPGFGLVGLLQPAPYDGVSGGTIVPAANGTPSPQDLEPMLPTVRSLQTRWQAYVPGAAPPSGYFVCMCRSGTPNPPPPTLVGLGALATELRTQELEPGGPGIPFVTTRFTRDATLFQVWADGTAWLLSTESGTHRYAPVDSVLPPSAEPDDGPPGEAAAPLGTVASGWSPITRGAASALAVGLTAGLLTYFAPLLRTLPAMLFSRVQPNELASHPQRARLLDAIAAQPGVHVLELARRTGMPAGTVRHHLRKMAQGGAVHLRRVGKHTCCFAARPDRGAVGRAAAVRSVGATGILDAVRQEPGLTGLQVAARTGLSPSTVSHHVGRLADAGLLVPQRAGREVRLHPARAAGAAASG